MNVFKINPLTRRESLFPDRSYNMNVAELVFSMIWNGLSHIFWNLVCLPYLCALCPIPKQDYEFVKILGW